MRVVFLSAARQVWGAEVSLLTLADALVDDGVPVGLVCPEGEFAARARDARFEAVEAMPAPQGAGELGRVRESAALWRTHLRTARRGDRLVLFSYYLLGLAPLFVPLLRARGVHVTLDFHDTLYSRKARWSVLLCSLFCERVIACSDYAARQLARHPRVAHLHRPVVPVDGPPPRPRPRPGTGRRLRVGIVGRISPEKRHGLLIDAVARAGDDVELVVRGGEDAESGTYPVDVARTGRERLGDRFAMEGRLAPQETMTDLDAVVVANPHEAMGRTVLEAQDRGVVPVVPDSGGAHELVEHEVTGLVYRSDDPADLARALDVVRRDDDLVEDMTSAGAAAVPRPAEYARAYLSLLP